MFGLAKTIADEEILRSTLRKAQEKIRISEIIMELPDLSTFGKRLRWAMDLAGQRKNRPLALKLNVSEGTIRNYLSRDTPPNDENVLAQIAKTLGVNLQWLATGEGLMRTFRQEKDLLEGKSRKDFPAPFELEYGVWVDPPEGESPKTAPVDPSREIMNIALFNLTRDMDAQDMVAFLREATKAAEEAKRFRKMQSEV